MDDPVVNQIRQVIMLAGELHLARTVALAALPFLLLYIRSWIRVPSNEKPVHFRWSIPEEARSASPTPAISRALPELTVAYPAPTFATSSSWQPKLILQHPSILAHQTQPDLIPSKASYSKSFITCYAPATGAHLATIPAHSGPEIADKIAAAEQAQVAWASTSWAQRRQVMYSLLSWLLRDVEAITKVCCRDTGKTSQCSRRARSSSPAGGHES